MTSIGRNAPCPCGSGKKYKKCCLEKDLAERRRRALATSSLVDPDEEQDPMNIDYEDLPENLDSKNTAWSRDMDQEEPSGRERTYLSEPTRYPKPCEELPDLPAEQQALVDAWWKTMEPLFKKMDADAMFRLVVEFMEEHPDLFVHLGLEHEVLFEIGGELGLRKEWSRYAGLLTRIRDEHPEMYVRSFSYYDYDLIIEALVSGKIEALPQYFSFFHQYPDSAPDNARRVTELLAWTGRQEELFAFAKPLAIPMWISPEVIGGWFMLRWLIFDVYVPLLDTNGNPKDVVSAMLQAVEHLKIPSGPAFDAEILQQAVRFRQETPDRWDFSTCKTDQDVDRFYHEVRWNYCGFLHDVKGFPWTRAFLLGDQLEDYWSDRPTNKKLKNPFMFDEDRLNKYLAKTCKDFFNINGVRAVSLLEAVWYFMEYLEVHSWIEEGKAQDIRQSCHHLFQVCLRVMDSTDPVPRLMPVFPEMVCVWE